MTEPGRIESGRLKVIKRLGDGGQGIVHLVGVPESTDPIMAYKEYLAESALEVDWAALDALVGLFNSSDDDTRAWLYEHTAWPSTVVTTNGVPRGFLMRVAPDDCYADLRTPKPTRTLLALEFLLNGPHYMTTVGLRVSDAQRLAVLHDLALILRRLHGLGIAIGDLSPKNLLFAIDPLPRCFVIDCDAVSHSGASVLRQIETGDWLVPAGEALATEQSDIYKLGLMTVRLLAGDQSYSDPSVIPPSMPGLADLARRSLSDDPTLRPSLAEWIAELDAAIPLASTQTITLTAPATAGSAGGSAGVTAGLAGAAGGVPSKVPGSPTVPGPPTAPAPGLVRTTKPGRVVALVGAALFVVVALCVGVTALANLGNDGDPTSDTSAFAFPPNPGQLGGAQEPSAGQQSSVQPEPAVTEVGLVDISAVAPDPRAANVARLFDAYFSGINFRQMDTVLGLYDPASSIGKADQNGRATFIHDVSTTTDSQVRVISLVDGGADGGVLTATLTFRSQQQPGYGPRRDPNEICSMWTVTYSLTEPSPTQYRILRGPGSSVPC